MTPPAAPKTAYALLCHVAAQAQRKPVESDLDGFAIVNDDGDDDFVFDDWDFMDEGEPPQPAVDHPGPLPLRIAAQV